MAGVTDVWPVPPSAHKGNVGHRTFLRAFFRSVIPKRVVLGGINVGSDLTWGILLLFIVYVHSC